MKNWFNLFLLFCFWSLVGSSVYAQPAGEWMWIHGSNVNLAQGNFGIKGVTNPTNTPPALYEALEWKDLSGNFWLYAGNNFNGLYLYSCAALWKYEPSINQWTWMSGTDSLNVPPHYGALGIPDSVSYPGARGLGGVSWVDLLGNLWLYGGSYNGPQSDLWKYDISTNQWTWVRGDSTAQHPPVYGVQGIPSINNSPGGRCEIATGWTDNAGDLWLFGGASNYGCKSDLWRYNIATNMWTWMKGASSDNQPGVYGTLGVEASDNTPGSRWSYSHWKDLSGNLWLWGGSTDLGDPDPDYYFSDLWRYNPSTNNWTWMHGDSVPNHTGLYGVNPCEDNTWNFPSARFENRACATDEKGNFWLYGGCRSQSPWRLKGDLWMYCVESNKWTWKGGNSANNAPVHWGTMNVPDSLNVPGAKMGATLWYEDAHLYLIGGFNGGTNEMYNGLWSFATDESCGGNCEPIHVNVTTDEEMKSDIKLYPNPATASITLTLETPTDNHLQNIFIYSTDGRLLKTINNNQSSIINVDVKDLSAGIYFLKVSSESGVGVKRFVKQ